MGYPKWLRMALEPWAMSQRGGTVPGRVRLPSKAAGTAAVQDAVATGQPAWQSAVLRRKHFTCPGGTIREKQGRPPPLELTVTHNFGMHRRVTVDWTWFSQGIELYCGRDSQNPMPWVPRSSGFMGLTVLAAPLFLFRHAAVAVSCCITRCSPVIRCTTMVSGLECPADLDEDQEVKRAASKPGGELHCRQPYPSRGDASRKTPTNDSRKT
jgi:hypothetical protein